jgi:hypothetical protein
MFVAAYILLNPILSGWGLVENYSAEKIAGTFMLRLNPSIGYVWIIRVFLIVMLVTPLLIKMDKALKNDWVCLGAIAAVLAAQHLLVGWLKPMKPGWFIQDWVLYICGYSAVFMWGLRARKASPAASCVALLMLAAVLCFCGYGMYEEHGTLMKLQATKYPPQLYFLVWGMFISGILWFTRKWWTKVMDNRLFTFIGQNTIWIYLWHIPFVNIVVKGPFDAWHPLWKYIFVYVAALCIYALQYKIVGMVRKRWPNNVITKYFVG